MYVIKSCDRSTTVDSEPFCNAIAYCYQIKMLYTLGAWQWMSAAVLSGTFYIFLCMFWGEGLRGILPIVNKTCISIILFLGVIYSKERTQRNTENVPSFP